MDDRILQLIPAEPGWRAWYSGEYEYDTESTPVVAWALVERGGGDRAVVGMVRDVDQPTKLVAAPDGGSAVVTAFARYGFRPTDL